MCQRGIGRAAGSAIDAWHEGGWWLGYLADPAGDAVAGAVFSSRAAGRRRGRDSAAEAPLLVVPDGGGEELCIPQVLSSVSLQSLAFLPNCAAARGA